MTYQIFLEQDQQEISRDDFISIESKVFLEKNGQIYIGGELVNETMRSLLRDQAENLKSTNLYEILNATIINESAQLALHQSGKSGDIKQDVLFAKALHHWNHVLKNMINALSKQEVTT